MENSDIIGSRVGNVKVGFYFVKVTDWKRLVAAGIILAAVGIVYGRSLDFDFVYDDHAQIEQNPWLRDPEGPRRWLTAPFWGFDPARAQSPSNYYRPLFGIGYATVARAWGIRPTPFHALSLILHAVVSLLVALGARRLGASQGAALFAGVLFAVHPVHVESVAWVAAQVDVLCAVFAVLAILSALRVRDDPAPGPAWLAAAPLGFFLACLTKETGAGLLPVLLAVEVHARGPARLRIRRLAPLLVALAAYLALRVHALGGLAPRDYRAAASLRDAVGLGFALLARYLRLLAVPAPAYVFAGLEVPSSLLSPPVLLGVASAAAVALGLWRLRGRPAAFLSLVTLVAFLVPALLANRIGGVNFAERYLYLPSIGFAWLVSLCADAVLGARGTAARRGASVLATAGLAALATVATLRIESYRSDLAFFTAAVRSAPDSAIVRNNLGAALAAANDWDGAAREYAAALRLDPGNADSWANLGAVRERQGDLAGAVDAYERARLREPLHGPAGLRLARVHRRSGNPRAAAEALDRLLTAGSATADVLLDRASLHLQEGDALAALALAERATVLFPEAPRGFLLLAQARYARGELPLAQAAAEEAVRKGAGPAPRKLLARLRWQQGDVAGARRYLEDALRLAPGDRAIQEQLALLARPDAPGPRDMINGPEGAVEPEDPHPRRPGSGSSRP